MLAQFWRGARGEGHLRPADPRPGRRCGDRHDLLHAGERPPPGGGAARPVSSTSSTAAQFGSTAPPYWRPPPKNSRAVPLANMVSRKLLSRPIYSTRRAEQLPRHGTAPWTHRRAGLESAQPRRPFQPGGVCPAGAGEELALPNLGLETVHHVHADDVAQAFMQAMAHWSTCRRRELPRRFAPGALFAWLRREHGGVVRPTGQPALPAMARMAHDRVARGSASHLGPHRPQPQLQHCQSATPHRLPAALQFAARRARSSHMADRARDCSVIDPPDSRRHHDRQIDAEME